MSKKEIPDETKKVDLRRQFIRGQVQIHGLVTYARIRKEGEEKNFKVSNESLVSDGQFFERFGSHIRLIPKKGKFVAKFPDTVWTYEIRQQENREYKISIAQLTCNLLCGVQHHEMKQSDHEKKTKKGSGDKIISLLNDQELNPGECASRVKKKIEVYFRKSNRSFYLDGGTSNAEIGKALSEGKDDGTQFVPDVKTRLHSLTAFTNSCRIQAFFEHPLNNIDVVVIGGQLRKSTLALTGTLAHSCVEKWGINPDIGLIGTTSAYLTSEGDWAFGSDSPEESKFKAEMLQRCSLRCIIMDASKCAQYRSSTFPFSYFSSERVDLVISDERILGNEPEFKKIRKEFCDGGIGLLVAKLNARE